jgi:hypothetical protein
MDLSKFKALSPDAQVGYMLLEGVCIADRMTQVHHILLFQVVTFYVEAYLDRVTSEVLTIESFASTSNLDVYLENINIAVLLGQETKELG